MTPNSTDSLSEVKSKNGALVPVVVVEESRIDAALALFDEIEPIYADRVEQETRNLARLIDALDTVLQTQAERL